MNTSKKTPLTAISLFSGAGGMDVGFRDAGYEIIWANEMNKSAAETYRRNFGDHIVCDDINANIETLERYKGVTCVFGGPPCQGFSVAGKMDLSDPRSRLVISFMRVIETTEPLCFVMENVKALATLEKFSSFREELFSYANRLGYKTELVILNSKDFGVPQSRERMFLIGFKGNPEMEIYSRSFGYRKPEITAKQALEKLGPVNTPGNESTCNADITIASNPVLRRSAYAGMIFNGMGRPISPDKPAQTLPASMGGNKTPIIDDRHFYGDGFSWIEEYHSSLWEGGEAIGMRDAPSNLRRLTLSEAKVLHTFPKNFDFSGPKTSIYTQIGNAVPCKLAEAVARMTIDIITDKKVESYFERQLKLPL